jgi:hypothetical protein
MTSLDRAERRNLALQGKEIQGNSGIQTGFNAINKSTAYISKKTPKFAKRALTGVKHVGESAINYVGNSRLGRYAANKIDDLSKIKRTGLSLSFNAGQTPKTIADVKTIGDLANIDGITQIMILLIGFLFFIVFWWCYNKIGLDKGPDKGVNCDIIKNVYTKFPPLRNINPDNAIYKNRVRDYYVKTAYNCCSTGKYKNDFVNICALKNCIKQGARCLDFEIYSLNGFPVIAVSSVNDFSVKESYNTLPFAKAMEIIASYAFSGGNCPNPNDPLFLHFRIMSSSIDIQNNMATALYNILEDRLLGSEFSYENNGVNIGAFPIADLMGKIIIMVDKSNPLFTDTKLNEYVNIASNSVFMRLLRYKDVAYTPDRDELISFNKENMTIALPNLSASNDNFSSALAMSYGCQFIGMSFQNFDDNMKYYTQLFDEAGSAFILRPERLRYIPVFIPKPVPQDTAVSTGTRTDTGIEGEEWTEINIRSDGDFSI